MFSSTDERSLLRVARRAQLQSLETILVVILLVIILFLGLFLYLRAAKSDERVSLRLSQQLRAEALVTRIASMPELSCPSFGGTKTPCIDLSKARIFSNMLQNNQSLRLRYYGVFGDTNVKIHQVYPTPDKSPSQISLYSGSAGENVVSYEVPVTLAIIQGETLVNALGVVRVAVE